MRTMRSLLSAAALASSFCALPAQAQDDAIDDAPIATAPKETVPPSALPAPTEPEMIPAVYAYQGPWIEPRPAIRRCESTTTLSLKRGRHYPYQVDVAPGKLVSENTTGAACDVYGVRVTNEFSAAMLLLADGNFGERGLAEELRFTTSLAKAVDTPLGTLEVEGFATYRAIDAGRGILMKYDDDYTTVGVRVAYPIRVKRVTVRLGYFNEKWNPWNYANSMNFHGPEIGIVGPGFFGGEASLDFANVRNENSTGATPHKQAWYAELANRWHFRNGLSFAVGLRYDQYGREDAWYDRQVLRDAKVVLTPRGDRKSIVLPQVNPFATLSFRKPFWPNWIG